MHKIPALDRKGLREFGVATGLIIIGLFGFFFPWMFSGIKLFHTYDFWGALGSPATALRWPFMLGSLLVAWGLVAPMSLNGVHRNWMKFGLVMSSVMTPLIMGVVFYFVFVPVGLVMKILGKDSMARKRDTNAETYRIISKDNPIKNLEKPF
ncbi:MAG: SxtJ family membrane protein [Halioglobus sp.]